MSGMVIFDFVKREVLVRNNDGTSQPVPQDLSLVGEASPPQRSSS